MTGFRCAGLVLAFAICAALTLSGEPVRQAGPSSVVDHPIKCSEEQLSPQESKRPAEKISTGPFGEALSV